MLLALRAVIAPPTQAQVFDRRLVQVVLNIMRNAVQASPEGQDCRITLRTRSQRQFTIGAVRHRLR